MEQMNAGCALLVDEISLADDSVLERLNSVLERERTLVLAEKGQASGSQVRLNVRDYSYLVPIYAFLS